MTTNSPCEYRMRLMKNGVTIFSSSATEPVEIGRRHAHEEPEPSLQRNAAGSLRLVAAALELRGFPRQLLRLECDEQTRLRIINLHEQAFVKLSNGQPIGPKQEAVVNFPMTVILPEGLSLEVSRVVVSMARTQLTPAAEEPMDDFAFALNSLSMAPSGLTGEGLSFGSSSGLSRNQSLTRMALEPTIFGRQHLGTVLEWLQQALAAMQRPAASAEFYSGIAKAVAQIIEVDRAEIILWDGKDWLRDESRSFVHADVPDPQSLRQPSFSLLNEARATRRITIHPQTGLLGRREMADSIRQIHAAVACPILDIFDGGDDILGVLYADRQTGPSAFVHEVMETEQKLIMILATAIASSIAKTNREKLVTKYQQFFSPKVTEAIRQNPQLLEGEDADVTVMFCDIRGFSRETDRIGPAAAMKWVSETLSELSEHVLKTDGVLVDYVGDELFAMWGAPDRAEDHAQRAVQSAREMMNLRKILSARFRETLPDGVDFGIGICTGPARVGNTGSRQKFKYGPLGRTVNLGSRLQGLTKQWKVSCVIDDVTEQALPKDILRRRLCMARVVGMEGSTGLFELMAENDDRQVELVAAYERALTLYECGTEPQQAVRAFGELVQQFPKDGPSLIMLVRAVNELVNPTTPFSPIWTAATK